jgi:hypothetical protein
MGNFREHVAIAVFFKKICRWRGEFYRTCGYGGVFAENQWLSR